MCVCVCVCVQADPQLQPVNLLEMRSIFPESPLQSPEVLLPGSASRFCPKQDVFSSTLSAVPATSSLLNKLKLPFAIHIHPYKEMPLNVSHKMITVYTYVLMNSVCS